VFLKAGLVLYLLLHERWALRFVEVEFAFDGQGEEETAKVAKGDRGVRDEVISLLTFKPGLGLTYTRHLVKTRNCFLKSRVPSRLPCWGALGMYLTYDGLL
jgi:hypothetical protein